MLGECSSCGSVYHFDIWSPQIYCSVKCQLNRDPLETEIISLKSNKSSSNTNLETENEQRLDGETI